jgi:hypothetical protein
VTDSVFYDEFGRIMMNAPVVGLDFTRYLPVIIVPYALLQVRGRAPESLPSPHECTVLLPFPVLWHGSELSSTCPSIVLMWLQVFGVFNNVLGAVVPNSRIEFDDDWEEKSDIAATGSRMLRWLLSVFSLWTQTAPWVLQICMGSTYPHINLVMAS